MYPFICLCILFHSARRSKKSIANASKTCCPNRSSGTDQIPDLEHQTFRTLPITSAYWLPVLPVLFLHCTQITSYLSSSFTISASWPFMFVRDHYSWKDNYWWSSYFAVQICTRSYHAWCIWNGGVMDDHKQPKSKETDSCNDALFKWTSCEVICSSLFAYFICYMFLSHQWFEFMCLFFPLPGCISSVNMSRSKAVTAELKTLYDTMRVPLLDFLTPLAFHWIHFVRDCSCAHLVDRYIQCWSLYKC